MTTPVRTTGEPVTLSHPFRTSALDRVQPAGTHRIVTDEEETIGLSFLAFRRKATMLHVPAIEVSATAREIVPIDSAEPDAILEGGFTRRPRGAPSAGPSGATSEDSTVAAS